MNWQRIKKLILANFDIATLKTLYPLVEISHRANDRNYMATVHQFNKSHRFIAVKGNPSEVLALCQYKLKDDVSVLLYQVRIIN